METVVSRNRPLADVLERATSDELDLIADLITDSGKGRLALDRNIKNIILARKKAGTLQSIADVLDDEIRAFGGNSFVNLTRGSKGVAYEELLTDVAEKMDVDVVAWWKVYDIEQAVIERAFVAFSLASSEGPNDDPLTEEAQAAALTGIVKSLIDPANGIKNLYASQDPSVFAKGFRGPLSPFRNVTSAITNVPLYQAPGPAFRITIPAVIHIANIRRRQIKAEMDQMREELKACL